MGKIENIVKSEIMRLAKREVRGAFLPLKREVRTIKLKLSKLFKSFASFDRLAKEQMRTTETEKLKLEATPEEVKKSRLTPERIQKLRQKLGISQRYLGILTGVNPLTVGFWEKGKFKPKSDKKTKLIALRKMKKRDVKNLLVKIQQREKANPEQAQPKKAKTRKLYQK